MAIHRRQNSDSWGGFAVTEPPRYKNPPPESDPPPIVSHHPTTKKTDHDAELCGTDLYLNWDRAYCMKCDTLVGHIVKRDGFYEGVKDETSPSEQLDQ